MENPNYVLKANEGVLVPKNEEKLYIYMKKLVLIILGVLIVSSFIFKENLFGGLSWGARILLVAIVISVCFLGGKKRVPSPFEIQFYNDYLIVYRKKHYFNKKLTRKEFFKFFYKDISKCEYRKVTNKINIYGIVEAVWYDYNKDGSLPEKPTYHRTTDGGICQFYTTETPEIDFVAEIESYSPIKVIIEEN